MKYDDASWHYGNEFPEESPNEFGGTHIALFLKYCFNKGWASKYHLDFHAEQIDKVLKGEMSATDFLFRYCDGQIGSQDFNEEGNEIIKVFYGDKGMYLPMYNIWYGHLIYLKGEEDIDFILYSKIIDAQISSGQLTIPQNEN